MHKEFYFQIQRIVKLLFLLVLGLFFISEVKISSAMAGNVIHFNIDNEDGPEDPVEEDTCSADAYIMPEDSVYTCDSLNLKAYVIPRKIILEETFNEDIDNSKWGLVAGGISSATCGAVEENAFYFNGDGNKRVLETLDLDVQAGGVLTFYLKSGFCAKCTCDKPENDEEDENLYLEYSIDGGLTWDTIQTFDADSYAVKNEFENIITDIPEEAKTTSTRFRWVQYQYNHLLNIDVWILDELKIRDGLSDYTYQWHPSSTLSNDTIADPVAFPNETTVYFVTITDKKSGCMYTDSVKVIFQTEFSAKTYSEFTFCPNDPKEPAFQLQASTPGGAIYTYEWYVNKNKTDYTIPNPQVAPTTSTLYTVVISNPATQCYLREDIYVNVPPEFKITMNDTSLCKGQKLKLIPSVDPPGNNYQYGWLTANGVDYSGVKEPEVNPQKDVDYTLYVKDTVTGCTKAEEVKLKVYPDFKVATSKIKTLCPETNGVEISVAAGPGTNFEYHWVTGNDITNPASTTQFVNPSSDTTYNVLVHQLDGCWKKDSVMVKLYNNILNLHVCNDTIINEGDRAFLYASGAPSYWWKNKSFILDTLASLYVAPQSKTIYTVIGYDDCYADTLQVTVDVNPLEFFIPNLITPNGDSKNESFRITNFGKRWNLEIFNRWGDLIYRKDSYIDEWPGKDDSEGIYYYSITDTKTDKKYQGWLQLVK